MAVRTQVLSGAQGRARSARLEIGREIRAARIGSGLSLKSVGRAIRRSASWVSRAERGLIAALTFDDLYVLGSAVGLKVWTSTFPAERAIQDEPQLKLLRRFRARIGESWTWKYEVVVPIVGDRRAADAVIAHGTAKAMIEAFTRFADAQAQIRAVLVKARDLGTDRVILVVAATHTNRNALAMASDVIAADFPLSTRATLAALADGRDPGANGLVVL
jgi:transcriptional regulator with XRE-family HTH domain